VKGLNRKATVQTINKIKSSAKNSRIAPRLLGEVLGELQRPTAIYIDGSKTEGSVGFGIFLDDMDSYRFRWPGHCGIFNAEMCAIHFACDLIEFKPMGAYIILTDGLASIEGLKSTGISYQTNDMLFRSSNQEVSEIS
jgi:hypothetical protein